MEMEYFNFTDMYHESTLKSFVCPLQPCRTNPQQRWEGTVLVTVLACPIFLWSHPRLKSAWKEKGLSSWHFHIEVHHWGKSRQETGGRNCSRTTEGCWLLPCPPWLAQPPFFDHLHRRPSHIITNQDSEPWTCWESNLTKDVIPQSMFSRCWWWAGVKMTKNWTTQS